MSGRATACGTRRGASIVRKVSPGTPATAKMAGHPLGVAGGELEGGVDPDRPAEHDDAVEAEVVQHRERVLDELLDADPGRVRGAVGPRDAAVVPGHDTDPAAGVEQRRPGPLADPEPVAQQHGRAVDLAVRVVGPGAQPGAVVGEDVGVPDDESRRTARSTAPWPAGRPGRAAWTCGDCAAGNRHGSGRSGPSRCPGSAVCGDAHRLDDAPRGSARPRRARRVGGRLGRRDAGVAAGCCWARDGPATENGEGGEASEAGLHEARLPGGTRTDVGSDPRPDDRPAGSRVRDDRVNSGRVFGAGGLSLESPSSACHAPQRGAMAMLPTLDRHPACRRAGASPSHPPGDARDDGHR